MGEPTGAPTVSPTESPTMTPTESPTVSPTMAPTMTPTESPTMTPTESPTMAPTMTPTTGCADDAGYTFTIDNGLVKTCSYLKKQSRINEYCGRKDKDVNDITSTPKKKVRAFCK